MPEIEYRPVSRLKADSAWLMDRRRDVTSQIGQDGILEAIFEVLGEGSRFCAEFGAWDGRWLSNTYNLIANRGWAGLLIEGDPNKAAEIKHTHPYDRVAAVSGLVGWEGDNALDNILSRHSAPKSPALVSIDVDGNDWHIWRSLIEHRPSVILIEFNPTVPNDVYFVQDPVSGLNQGASLLAMIELGKSKGYSLACANMWDAFFVVDELFPALNIADNSIDAMYYYPEAQTRLFQGYDSTLYTAGNLNLIWKNVPFEPDELQLLPRKLRTMSG